MLLKIQRIYQEDIFISVINKLRIGELCYIKIYNIFICSIFIYLSLIFISSTYSHACSSIPENMREHHYNLVNKTKNIFLAKAVKGNNKSDVNLVLLENIKGIMKKDGKNLIKFNNSTMEDADSFLEELGLYGVTSTDFDGHRNLLFWNKGLTRSKVGVDCRIEPKFVEGRKYLIFWNSNHIRSYEEVNSKNDLWLTTIKRIIHNNGKYFGINMDINNFVSLFYSSFLGKISNCESGILKISKIISGEIINEWKIPGYKKSDTECLDKQEFFVAFYTKNRNEKFRFLYLILPVVEGRVDFSQILENSEISISGDTIYTIQ